MKTIFNVLFLTLLIHSTVSADLSVNFNNQAVGIASGGTAPGDAVPTGSLMQLIWAATGSELSSSNAFNNQIGIGKSLSGEYILDEQVTVNAFGFYGPSTGVYGNADVGGADINSGYFFLRAFDSSQGAVGGYVHDFFEVDASAWVYNAVDTGTIYQGNLTGGTPGTFVDIQDSGFQILDAPVTGLISTNISSINYTGDISSGLSIDFSEGNGLVVMNDVTNIIGSAGVNVTNDAPNQTPAIARGFDAIEISGAREIYITNVVENILGGDGAIGTITIANLKEANASGGNGIELDFNAESRIFVTDRVKISGGKGGNAVGRALNTLTANGGSAVKGTHGIYTLNGIFTGGDAGVGQLGTDDINNTSQVNIQLSGGHAVELDLKNSTILPILSTNTQFIGGSGGRLIYSGVGTDKYMTNIVLKIDGGHGLHLINSDNEFNDSKIITVDGSVFTGGNADITTFVPVANGNALGGHGLYFGGGQNLVISNGVFTGGNGGVITTTASGSGSAYGGSGAYLKNVGSITNRAQIIGGTFSGGDGGTVDGVSERDGYALVLEDAHVELYAGVDLQDDLLVKADTISSSTIIHAGDYSDVYFSGSSTNRSYFDIKDGKFGSIYINEAAGYDGVITGGTLEDINISGSENQNLQISGGTLNNIITTGTGSNELRFGGSTINGDITFNNSGLNNLWLSNSVNLTTSGKLTINDGEVNVNAWVMNHIQNIIIDDGKLNFNDLDFESASQSSIELTHKNSHLNFNNNQAVISSGTELNLGLGRLSGSNLVLDADSLVTFTMSDKEGSAEPLLGMIDVSETIDLKTGAQLRFLNDGTYTRLSELQTSDNPSFIIANASAITNNLVLDDIELSGVQASWLSGFDLEVRDNQSDNTEDLLITFGFKSLKEEINATGKLARLADALQRILEEEAAVHDFIVAELSPLSASHALNEGFLRTPEVANSLIGLQSVVRDQVAGRTRGYLKANRFGASAPSGARGPDAGWWDRSMERINESLPKADLRGGLDALNASLPKVELSLDRQENQQQSYYKRFMNWLNEKAPSFKPSAPTLTSDDKSWGKAYYSDLAQDAADGFAGYEAQVVGGIAGIDRQLDHGVLGWAAGYADTTILGNFGQNADVDTLHGTIYYTIATQRAYLDASMSYAYSLVETIGPAGVGEYTADYTASNLSFSLGAGVGFTTFDDRIQITPEVLAQCSFYDQEAYTESSSVSGMPDKQFRAYDEWSPSIELGVILSPMQVLESTSMNLAIQPEFRIHWLHELNLTLDPQIYSFNGSSFSAASQNREENLLRTGLGIHFWDWADHRTEFSFDLDAITGSDYEEYTVSGSIIHRF